MKKSFIVFGLCILLVGMPIGLSDCGCTQPNDTNVDQQSVQPWISDADITALQEQGIKEGWTFTIGKNPATERPLSQLCGLVEPENWWVNASFDPCIPTSKLPDHFDWRELGGCTPIKDQDGCGSCWAFGTIAPLECNILIKDHTEVDLSEQWLVSCNQNNWGCSGGWWAHSYFQWNTDQFHGTGAVLEEEFPYVARDASCNGPYHHPYTIDSWHYVGLSQGVAQTDAIKQAIMTYGPVSVSCAVTGAFGAYSGGVFNENDPHAQINHAVALVGWDDNQGTDGVWFLRNSWGTGWGEEGYMRIEYGVCKVGYAACYVNYPARTKVEISSGLLGFSIGFRNVWNTTTTNIKWNVILKGGILGVTDDLTMQGTIVSIEPGMVAYEKILLIGFGPISISITAEPKNAGKLSKYAEGFLYGFLLFIPQNQ
ncbi:Papain family cysteine protease [uncultured archaeon]|nr:Papain family cysteine protease [uncultured archaeon]